MARYIPRLLSEPSYILRSSCENNLTSAVLITLCKPADGPESWNQWRGEIDRRLTMASPCDLNAGSANRAAMAPTRSDTRQTTPHQPILETTQAVTDCIWLRMAYTSDNNNTQNYSQASLLISLYIFNTKTTPKQQPRPHSDTPSTLLITEADGNKQTTKHLGAGRSKVGKLKKIK